MATITGTFNSLVSGTLTGNLGTPGPQGSPGATGATGAAGATGAGVAVGGTTGQVLQKLSATNYDTGWATPASDFITAVTAPLAVTSGNLSVNLSAYLPLAGGAMDVDATITLEDATLDRVSEVAGFGFSVSSASNINLKTNVLFDRVQVANVTSATSIIPTGVEFPDLTLQTTAGISAATAASTYQTLSGMSSYLTTSTAASTYTTFGYTASTYFLLAGGALNLNTNITASNTSDSDSEMAGFGFGVQKSSDHTKGTTVEFDGLDTYDGASHMNVNPTGLTFPDATTQTTSATNLGYISQGTADGLYYSISNPSGFTNNTFGASEAIQAVSNNYASSVGNYPSSGNYLKYNGTTLEWDTPGGGGGYITSVTAPLSVSAGDLSVYLGDYYLNSNPNGFTNYQDSNAISAISGGATSSISGSPSSGNVLGYNGSQITWVSNGSPYYNSVWAYGNWYSANVTGIYDGYMNYYTVLTF